MIGSHVRSLQEAAEKSVKIAIDAEDWGESGHALAAYQLAAIQSLHLSLLEVLAAVRDIREHLSMQGRGTVQ